MLPRQTVSISTLPPVSSLGGFGRLDDDQKDNNAKERFIHDGLFFLDGLSSRMELFMIMLVLGDDYNDSCTWNQHGLTTSLYMQLESWMVQSNYELADDQDHSLSIWMTSRNFSTITLRKSAEHRSHGPSQPPTL